MADNLQSFAKLVELVARRAGRFRVSHRYDKPTKRPHRLRKARNRRLNVVAREQRKLNRPDKSDRSLRTPPQERRA